MNVQDVQAALAEHRPELTRMGVSSLSVFGSVVRGEARADSDVDLLVEFDRPVGLFAFARLQAQLSTWLGRRVDLVEPEALKRQLRDGILKEAVRAA